MAVQFLLYLAAEENNKNKNGIYQEYIVTHHQKDGC